MIMIFGTVVQNDDIYGSFYEIVIFQVVTVVKGQKITQNKK